MKQYGWLKQAACSEADSDIFFNPVHERLALSFCAACPVADKCAEMWWAYDWRWGVAGGTTESERAEIAARFGVRTDTPKGDPAVGLALQATCDLASARVQQANLEAAS